MRNKKLFVLMIGMIVFIAVMGFSLQRKEVSWPEKFVNDSVSFVQQWFYKPAGYIAGLFHDIRTMRDIYEENERLRTTVAAYTRDKIRLNQLEKKIADLEKDLQFTERQKKLDDYTYMIAQVTSISQDPLNPTINIDLGSKNGIKPNMPVVDVNGLVGLVDKVTPFYSTVMPYTQLDSKSPTSPAISATVFNKPGSFGVIDNYNEQTGMLEMSMIPELDPLANGDTVISAGLGGIFPYGLIIGTVKTNQVGDFGLTRVATIEPAADVDKLTEVFVVKAPELEGMP